jgi:uncharacterized membrane protein (DUF4010 family)
MSAEQLVYYHLGVALAIGLLVGVERGWRERQVAEGQRVAGVRTYGLIGLLGGGSALLSGHLGVVFLGLAFLGVALALTTVYVANLEHDPDDLSMTSLVAGLLTFVLGALSGMGEVAVAAASAVVATLLLSYKPVLHRWLRGLEQDELRAAIKLLLISVVLLPVLPDEGYGPWQALNPYEIWWMVVLIALISFVGYFAVKIGGARRGAVFTGLFGGLAASTAVTLHFSRLSKRDPEMAPLLGTAILLACGTMLPRTVLVASLVNRELLPLLLLPAAVMATVIYAPTLLYWRLQSHREVTTVSPLRNPLELKTALGFGLLLGLVMLLGQALRNTVGDIGVLALAAASGITDVDAITLSLARMGLDDLTIRVAASGIIVAAAVNSLVKAGMAAVVGGRAIAPQVVLPLVAAAVGGPISAWLWIW